MQEPTAAEAQRTVDYSTASYVPAGATPAPEPIFIEGYEMLKGLSGVTTHEHREWVPILENSQDMQALAAETTRLLEDDPKVHGFLIRRHGMYTWGADLVEAARHVEILEFLLESVGRRQMMEPQY